MERMEYTAESKDTIQRIPDRLFSVMGENRLPWSCERDMDMALIGYRLSKVARPDPVKG